MSLQSPNPFGLPDTLDSAHDSGLSSCPVFCRSTLLRGAVVPTKAPSSGFTLTMAGGHRDRSDVIKAQKKAVKGYLGADDIGDGLPDDIKRYGKGWMNAGGQGGWTSAK